MNPYQLRLVYIGREPLMEQSFRQAACPERFSHSVRMDPAPEEGELRRADGIVLDVSQCALSPARVRALGKPGAVLVVCAAAQALPALGEESLQAADEFWETPLDARLLNVRARRLLERLGSYKEQWLYQTYLDTAIDSIPDLVWFKDRDGAHLKVNRAFCQTVGKSREDVTGRDHCYIWDVSPEDYERGEFVCKETEEIVMRERRTCLFTEKVKGQHGLRQFRTYKSPLFGEDGEIIGTVGIGHDVTDLENMGAELEIILRSMPFAILVRNDQGIILNANEKFEEYFGMRKEVVTGQGFDAWTAGAFERGYVNGEGFVESRIRGSVPERIVEIHEEPIYDVFRNVAGYLSIYRDVTTERALEQQILRNSNTDFMTGLNNRRAFYQFIQQNRPGKTVSLLYVDLDHFKEINDTFGHRAGDEALVRTARLMLECFPADFIARVGGDEFLVAVLGECPVSELERKAGTLLRRMRETFGPSEQLSRLSASIGIAQSSDPEMDIDTLIQQGDTALYEAKERGKARYCVYGAGEGASSR